MQTLEWMADCLALVVLMVGVALRYRIGDNLPGFLRFREPAETPRPPVAARRRRAGRPAARPIHPAHRRPSADRHA